MWAELGARVNTTEPGITHLDEELIGPRGPSTRRMMDFCLVGRAGTPDEVGTVGALLMGGGASITESNVLINGSVTSYVYGDLVPGR